jgi:hypothetical protein
LLGFSRSAVVFCRLVGEWWRAPVDYAAQVPPGETRMTALWNAFGQKMIERLADGSRTLAVLWQRA